MIDSKENIDKKRNCIDEILLEFSKELAEHEEFIKKTNYEFAVYELAMKNMAIDLMADEDPEEHSMEIVNRYIANARKQLERGDD